jgi:hypothetical protein
MMEKGQKSRSPSYADYRSKTNTVVLLDVRHTQRGERAQEEQGKREENLKLERG